MPALALQVRVFAKTSKPRLKLAAYLNYGMAS